MNSVRMRAPKLGGGSMSLAGMSSTAFTASTTTPTSCRSAPAWISLIARMPIAKDSPPRTNIRYCLGWSAATEAAAAAVASASRSVWSCAIFLSLLESVAASELRELRLARLRGDGAGEVRSHFPDLAGHLRRHARSASGLSDRLAGAGDFEERHRLLELLGLAAHLLGRGRKLLGRGGVLLRRLAELGHGGIDLRHTARLLLRGG